MEFQHQWLKEPNANSKIWRYMDFTKFVSLLDKSSLFFVRADKLGDPFEGSHPKRAVKLRETIIPEEFKTKEELFKGWAEWTQTWLKYTVISCWHLNEQESAAMWKLYLKSDEGIAIQSTFSRLSNSIHPKRRKAIHIYKVKYIDYEKGMAPVNYHPIIPFFCKRKSFAHERELRAVRQTILPPEGLSKVKPIQHGGKYIKVNLDLLIERIYLAPSSPTWLFELVKSVERKYGLNKEICQSSLDKAPLY